MKDSIKKKFLDILFEPEDDEEQDLFADESVKEYRRPEKKTEIDPNLKAKDILYKKPEKSSVFVDLEESKPVRNETVQEIRPDNDYEFSSQISPIFGVLKESPHVSVRKSETDEKLINKPESSHLEIITSPIFGYGQREEENDDAINEEEELHNLFDEEREEIVYDHTYDDLDAEEEEINLFSPYQEEL